MKLSICVATYNRANFIGDTLDTILPQLTPEVELVVVDGASTDATPEVMANYLRRHPAIVYRREARNCGVDQDFDKAVSYALGEYCWLMSDDDLLVPDAVATVLANLASGPELLLVNAQVRSRDLSVPLKERQLAVEADQDFEAGDEARVFATTASYLSFIGAVVIRRSAWLARERAAYYGSLFIHVGVIFQPPAIGRTRLLARPLVHIRYGNAMWTARGFEVWMFQWPQMVWSFDRFDAAVRQGVTPRHPACSLKVLLHYRAIGAYGPAEYAGFLAGGQRPHHPLARQVAALPAGLVNGAVALYCLARGHEGARMMLYDLLRSRCATGVTRWAARRLRLPDA